MLAFTTATITDAEQILALQRRAYASEARLYNDWTIPPLMQTLESMCEDIRSIAVIKAMEDGALVGSVRGRLSEGTCLVGRLIVEPAHQGRGIGGALLKAIEHAFPQAAAFELFTGLQSERNIRLYQRNGYTVVGTRALSEALSVVVLRKPGTISDEPE